MIYYTEFFVLVTQITSLLPDNWDVEIDLPDNYFRIQLCCLLLNNLKSIFIDTDIPSKKKAQTVLLN